VVFRGLIVGLRAFTFLGDGNVHSRPQTSDADSEEI